MPSLRSRLLTPLAVRFAQRAEPSVASARRRALEPRVRGVTVTREAVDGIPVERYVPGAGARREGTHLFVHGGAFVAGSAQNSRRWPALVAVALGMETFSVDYRLAPEHPFPAGAQDVAHVVQVLQPRVLSGESAGGCLALSALQLVEARPDAVVLLSTAADLTMSAESLRTNSGRDVLTLPVVTWARDSYLAGHPASDPVASPLHADLSTMPPTLLQVGDRDMLLDDSRRLARRLEEAGVLATLQVWPGMVHRFTGVPRLLPESRRALAEAVAWLVPVLDRPTTEVTA